MDPVWIAIGGFIFGSIRNVAVKLFMAMPDDGERLLRDENTFCICAA